METFLFYILSLIAVASAVLAITRLNPLATALWLIGCFLAIAGLMGLLGAPLVALFQILLAAGAIMVLFIFVIMLIELEPSRLGGRAIRFGKVLGAFAAAYLIAVEAIAVIKPPFHTAPTGDESFTVSALGQLLVSKYALPFELIAVLLVIAMVGAVSLGKRKT